MNSGQSCNAPTRMLVPRANRRGRRRSRRRRPRPPWSATPDQADTIGPVVSKAQFDKIQRLIENGIEEGAKLVAGGPGGPKAWNAATMCSPRSSPTSATT